MSRCYRLLLAGGALGCVLALILVGLGCLAAGSPFGIIAVVVGGSVAAVITISMIRGAFTLHPVGDPIRAIPEAEKVLERGYEFWFHQGRASKIFQRWVFTASWGARTVGRLDVDFIGARKCLYVSNVYVVEPHGNRGLGTVLLLCAAKTTDCEIVTTSSRTRQGARFFEKTKPVLKGHGIELRDSSPYPHAKGR